MCKKAEVLLLVKHSLYRLYISFPFHYILVLLCRILTIVAQTVISWPSLHVCQPFCYQKSIPLFTHQDDIKILNIHTSTGRYVVSWCVYRSLHTRDLFVVRTPGSAGLSGFYCETQGQVSWLKLADISLYKSHFLAYINWSFMSNSSFLTMNLVGGPGSTILNWTTHSRGSLIL